MIDGGPGRDRATLTALISQTVRLDGAANDGISGEGDSHLSIGVLTGSPTNDTLSCGEGRDEAIVDLVDTVLEGRGGIITLTSGRRERVERVATDDGPPARAVPRRPLRIARDGWLRVDPRRPARVLAAAARSASAAPPRFAFSSARPTHGACARAMMRCDPGSRRRG